MRDVLWRVFADTDALTRAAAEHIVTTIEASGETPSICLTGGSTPGPIYALLAQEPWASRIPWERTHWFVGDERFVPPDDDKSNLGQARRLLLDAHAPAANVHAVRTDLPDVHAAATAYEDDLRRFAARRGGLGLFDLVLLGVGPDGHVASIFPHSAAASERMRWAVGVDEPGLPPRVPRVTLTFDALSSARETMFLVAGRDKAPVLAQIARGAELPATTVTQQGRATWLVAADAAPPDAALGARLILAMGVSGSGKTTVGRALSKELGWSFLDADDLHPQANMDKMRSGAPLTDDDRAPWLRAVAAELARRTAAGLDVVVACSALKRSYRDALLAPHPRNRIVSLEGAPGLIAARLGARKGHFMPASQLDDQLHVLQPPAPDESALVVDIALPTPAQIAAITRALAAFLNAGRLETRLRS